MTDEQFQTIKNQLANILDNQIVIDRKVDRLQHDIEVVIGNDRIFGQDQDDLIEQVREIRQLLRK